MLSRNTPAWESSGLRILANRRNALKSTGPRSVPGKRRVALNARRRGLCSEQLEQFRAGARTRGSSQSTRPRVEAGKQRVGLRIGLEAGRSEMTAGEQPPKRVMLRRINGIHLCAKRLSIPKAGLLASVRRRPASRENKPKNKPNPANTLVVKEMPGNGAEQTD